MNYFAFMLDMRLRITWINRTLPPYTVEQTIGRKPWEFSELEQERDLIYIAASRCLTERAVTQSEATVIVADGERTFHTEYQPIEFAPNYVHGISRMIAASDKHIPPRQREIAKLLLVGLSRKQIAAELDLSPSTVATHVARLYKNVGVSGVGALSRIGQQYGWC